MNTITQQEYNEAMAWGINSAQEIVSEVSGYVPLKELSAKNDYYYDECETHDQKYNFLIELIEQRFKVEWNQKMSDSVEEIINFLDAQDEMSSNERFYAYAALEKVC